MITDAAAHPGRLSLPLLPAGEDLSGEFSKQADIVYQDTTMTAFVSSAWWPGNSGNVIVIPNARYESVYESPDAVLAAIQVLGNRIWR
jgi:diadenosine tetraphosphate (Ap4A) HIT family hydrolase